MKCPTVRSKVTFVVEDIRITAQRYVKYLGIWVDDKLSYKEHVRKTIQKAAEKIKALLSLMPTITFVLRCMSLYVCTSLTLTILLYLQKEYSIKNADVYIQSQ